MVGVPHTQALATSDCGLLWELARQVVINKIPEELYTGGRRFLLKLDLLSLEGIWTVEGDPDTKGSLWLMNLASYGLLMLPNSWLYVHPALPCQSDPAWRLTRPLLS